MAGGGWSTSGFISMAQLISFKVDMPPYYRDHELGFRVHRSVRKALHRG